MALKIMKVNNEAILPTKGTKYSAGLDLCTCQDADIPSGESVMLGTGLAMEIPEGYFGAIFARSGLSCKQGLRPSTCVSVIDSDYRGEVKVPLYNDSKEIRHISKGDRISQLVILPYLNTDIQEVNTLEKTERGTGGFGSTGKN